MPNQLFYPKSTTMYRISSESDTIYLPSPRNLIIPNAIAGGATAGPLIECDFPLAKGMVKVGDLIYNNDIGNIKRGEMCSITEIDYAANTIKIPLNVGVIATTPFRIYRNAPDPCLIMPPGIVDKNDAWSLEDAEGNQFDFAAGSPVAMYGLYPLPVQVTRWLKTGTVVTDPTIGFILCLHN